MTRRATVAVPVPSVAGVLLPEDVQQTFTLLESLRHTSVVRDTGRELFGIRPMGVDAAIAAALHEP